MAPKRRQSVGTSGQDAAAGSAQRLPRRSDRIQRMKEDGYPSNSPQRSPSPKHQDKPVRDAPEPIDSNSPPSPSDHSDSDETPEEETSLEDTIHRSLQAFERQAQHGTATRRTKEQIDAIRAHHMRELRNAVKNSVLEAITLIMRNITWFIKRFLARILMACAFIWIIIGLINMLTHSLQIWCEDSRLARFTSDVTFGFCPDYVSLGQESRERYASFKNTRDSIATVFESSAEIMEMSIISPAIVNEVNNIFVMLDTRSSFFGNPYTVKGSLLTVLGQVNLIEDRLGVFNKGGQLLLSKMAAGAEYLHEQCNIYSLREPNRTALASVSEVALFKFAPSLWRNTPLSIFYGSFIEFCYHQIHLLGKINDYATDVLQALNELTQSLSSLEGPLSEDHAAMQTLCTPVTSTKPGILFGSWTLTLTGHLPIVCYQKPDKARKAVDDLLRVVSTMTQKAREAREHYQTLMIGYRHVVYLAEVHVDRATSASTPTGPESIHQSLNDVCSHLKISLSEMTLLRRSFFSTLMPGFKGPKSQQIFKMILERTAPTTSIVTTVASPTKEPKRAKTTAAATPEKPGEKFRIGTKTKTQDAHTNRASRVRDADEVGSLLASIFPVLRMPYVQRQP